MRSSDVAIVAVLACGAALGGCGTDARGDAAGADGATDTARDAGGGRDALGDAADVAAAFDADGGDAGAAFDAPDAVGPDAPASDATGDAAARCPGFAPPPQSGGRTYYVAPTGSDGNAGTETAPWQTLQRAANAVAPGDTVVVEDGTYTAAGSRIASIDRGGTATNWVWFRARHRWGARLDGRSGANASGLAFGTGVGYVRVEGFEIFGQAADGSADAIECYAGGHDVQIVGNHIHDIGHNCTNTTNGESGIFVQQPNVRIEGNLIHDIGRLAPGEMGCMPTNMYYQNHDHGIYVDGDPPGASGVVIANNVFYAIRRGWSVQLYPRSLSDVRIENNTFVDPNPYHDGQIVMAASLTGAAVRNNVFALPRNAAIDVQPGITFATSAVTENLTTVPAMLDVATPAGLLVATNATGTDPLFVNATSHDYHVQAGSPAIDRGATLSEIAVDFDGCTRPRGGGYDLGAFEQ